jgi:hypothetical protein
MPAAIAAGSADFDADDIDTHYWYAISWLRHWLAIALLIDISFIAFTDIDRWFSAIFHIAILIDITPLLLPLIFS